MSDAGRRWLEVSVSCPSAGELAPLLADALVAEGARGVIERGGSFVSYFEEPVDVERFVADLLRTLTESTDLAGISVGHEWQPHEEWAETWKRGLAPRRVTERIVVHPSWTTPADRRDDDVVIVLDPGMAFGTAEHGTTRGCLRLLDGLVRKGDRLLDVGAGSGILAIAAARLGAAEVTAIEGDPYACEALVENVERNDVGHAVRLQERWATAESLAAAGPVDGVIANIERGLLVPLLDGFRDVLAADDWMIVSGILDHEWSDFADVVASSGFRRMEVDADGEWRSGRFERISD